LRFFSSRSAKKQVNGLTPPREQLASAEFPQMGKASLITVIEAAKFICLISPDS